MKMEWQAGEWRPDEKFFSFLTYYLYSFSQVILPCDLNIMKYFEIYSENSVFHILFPSSQFLSMLLTFALSERCFIKQR